LNGQVMQDRTNEDWVFPLPRLLAWLSSAMTLEPCSRGNRARAQVCVLEIDRIGRLENPVVSIG
jgi:hypothetical protein